MDDEKISIPTKRYIELIEAENQLLHLIANGVDNWENYSYYKWDDEEDEDE